MFQQKQIEEYQNITAPTELKDRVRFSVNKARRTARQRIMMMTALAAGVTLFCVAGSLLGNSSTILSVNDVVVSREALPIENEDSVLLTANMGQQRSLPIYIPMKLEVTGKTVLEVSIGTLVMEIGENQYSKEMTKLELSEDAKVYWILDEEMKEKCFVCTVTKGRHTDTYEVEYRKDTESYSIRKTN